MKSKRNRFWKISVFALLFAVLAVISIGCAFADTIYVPEGGNQTIQQAVNNATAGDTIIVRDAYTGTKENIVVSKSYLTIRSENGSANCIVSASNLNDHVFEVTRDYVNISGFTVENATKRAGIYFHTVEHCNISYNNVTNNDDGIRLYYSSNNTFINNIASNNYHDGIYLKSSSNNTLINNIASNNDYGIYLYYSSNNTLINNTASNNYYDDICSSICGIYLYYSSNNTLINNTASNSYYGIYLYYSSNNTLINNTASNSYYGIYLYYSSNNTLINNIASNNYYGIYLRFSSNNNTLINNTASNSYYDGVYLYDSSNNNHLYRNNFINNTNHNAYDYDTITNQWNTSTVGNYYSDYTGSDNNSDGIGDTSYQIRGGSSIDYFPLMRPWGKTPLKGDLDDDDKITSKDAAIALQIAVGSRPFDDDADVSGDGRVSSLDALIILQMVT